MHHAAALRVAAFIDVFKHHHAGSGKGSEHSPPPFVRQQQIHPHFSPIYLHTPLFLPLLSVLFLATGQMFSSTHQLLLMFFKLSELMVEGACAANQQQQLYFPPRFRQMMYSATYNCATD